MVIFEATNEPALANPTQATASAAYVATLKAIRDGTSRLANTKIAGPSYIPNNGGTTYAQDVSGSVDYGNVHAYRGNDYPETTSGAGLAATIATSAGIFPGKPSLVTEDGYNSAMGQSSFLPVSEAARARYLPRELLFNFLAGVPKTYLYELISSFADDNTNPESRFGLEAFDGTKRPAYYAVKNLIEKIDGAPAASRQPAGAALLTSYVSNIRAVNFQRPDGGNRLAVWLQANSGAGASPNAPLSQSVNVSLPGAVNPKVHRIGDDGQAVTTSLTLVNGQVAINVSDQLSIVES